MGCTACNAPLAPNDKFCAACGAVQQNAAQVSEIIEDSADNQVTTTCDRCGAGLVSGQIFCTVCGKPSVQLGEE